MTRILEKIRRVNRLRRDIRNWIRIIFEMKILQKKDIIFRLRKPDVKLMLEAKSVDLGILYDILQKTYTPEGFMIKEDDTIVDIGAQRGIFSVYAGAFAKKGCIISFEPESKNFQYLQKNIELNNLENIKVNKCAIGGERGKRKLYLCEGNNTGGHSLYASYRRGFEEVEIITLGEVFSKYNIQRCNLLKLDCEGSEYEILYSLKARNLNKIEKIAFEHHIVMGEDINKLKKYLEKNRFKVIIKDHMGYAVKEAS